MARLDEISLYRQFLWARELRAEYRQEHLAHEDLFARAHRGEVGSYEQGFRPDMYMCLWYGVLNVVAEGYEELGLTNPEVDKLLSQPERDLLRRFRNAVFHPTSHKDRRLEEMVRAGEQSRAWVDSLTDAMAAYFASIEETDRESRLPSTGKTPR